MMTVAKSWPEQDDATERFRSFLRDLRNTKNGHACSESCLTLNPSFVEWLMGWPIGSTGFEPLETGSSRFKPLMRSALCGLPTDSHLEIWADPSAEPIQMGLL